MSPSDLLTLPTDPIAGRDTPRLRLKLTVIAGASFGADLPLERGTYRVGKSKRSDLVLDDAAVSRTHLIIEVLPDGVRLTDNGSKNGTRCNGVRFETVIAAAGSVIELGGTTLKILPVAERVSPLAPSASERFGELTGRSLAMRQVFAVLERVAPTDASILVTGETGTGKELCARAIHGGSAHAKGPFVVCDLAAIAPALFESELFGHIRGSFTGAVADRPGAFESAHGGTLFLDEIGELPSDVQPRLLRALETRQVKRVGANRHETFDVRVIAATHRDLKDEAAVGRFREDLFYRLAVVQVRLPALRERPEDIPMLIDAILVKLGKSDSVLSQETRALLADYAWPGNVRELRNVVERTVSLGADAQLPGAAAAARVEGGEPLEFREAKERVLAAFERDYVANLLASCEGNVSRAARRAGIHRVHLHRLMKRHGLTGQES